MPFLSDLASRAVYYGRAYSAAPWTLPSVASLFTAQYPSEHGVGRQWFQSRLPDSVATLAGVLTANGYTTVGLSAHDGVNRDNVGRGFERFDIVGERATLARDANDVNAAALAWLQASPRKPWFMYLHYLDVHHYREHPGLTAAHSDETGRDDQTLRAKVGAGVLSDSEAARRDAWDFTPQEVARLHQLYDGEARYVDERLRALFAELERRGALANTIVVITADHGEQFGRHLTFGHGTNLYETLVRVPLIIALPANRAGRSTRPRRMPASPRRCCAS